MGLMMCEGKFVDRNEVALVDTPRATESWHPVPHIEVIEAVTEVAKAHGWEIISERYGLAREGQKLFGVMEINKSSSPDWTRCIGLRNSHDMSFAAGLTAGICVCVCSNMAFGGTTILKRRHTSGIDMKELVFTAIHSLEQEFLITETRTEELRVQYLRNDDEARVAIVRAAELGVINSSDILPVFKEFRHPQHEEFSEPTRYSLMNAMTEVVKKYTPQRVDQTYLALNRAFGLDGTKPEIFAC